jgi:ribosomal protein L12E/L44/L45/RPP1/RPP2
MQQLILVLLTLTATAQPHAADSEVADRIGNLIRAAGNADSDEARLKHLRELRGQSNLDDVLRRDAACRSRSRPAARAYSA